jgi:hypothetical protein
MAWVGFDENRTVTRRIPYFAGAGRLRGMKPTAIESLEPRIAPAASSIDLSGLTGAAGIKLSGPATLSSVGSSIASAGDVNGDGIDDLIIGGPDDSLGSAFIVFGKKGGFTAPINLGALNGTDGFKLTGRASGNKTGLAVSSAGDFNGDGFDDVLIGAPSADDPAGNAGAVFLIYGKPTAFPATISLASLAGLGTRIRGEGTNDQIGTSVAAAGDVNGDGLDDIVIGGIDGSAAALGGGYVIFGKASGLGDTFTVDALNGTNGFEIPTPNASILRLGKAVAGGDFNGDGFSDIAIGASDSDEGGSSRGAAFVIYGRSSFPAVVSLTSLNGSAGFKLAGTVDSARLGSTLSFGDVNGDGFDDLIAGALNEGGGQNGAVYVVFGRNGGTGATLLTSALDGGTGFRIGGVGTMGFLGSAVSAAGDFNGDSINDILLGASFATEIGAAAGAAYLIYGHTGSFGANFDVTTLDGNNGFKMRGPATEAQAGASVYLGGDFNGDGLDDILVGAPGVGGSIAAGANGAGFVVSGFGTKVNLSKDGRTATFVEPDGDLVTVKVSKGKLLREDLVFSPDGVFQKLDLRDDHGTFAGATVSITAKKAKGGSGDGRVNVGAIDARGQDLLSVKVGGDLGQIDCGDDNFTTRGLGSLTIGSLSAIPGTQLPGTIEPSQSRIQGSLGKVSVTGDVFGFLNIAGALGSAKIGHDLSGAAGGATAGLIRASGNIGSVSVGHDIIGGADFSGILSGGKLGKVNVGGSLIGSSLTKLVSITALGKLNPVSVADATAIASVSVKGGSTFARIVAGVSTSLVASNGDAGIGSVSIGGGFIGTSIAAGIADTSVTGDLNSVTNGYGRNDTALGGGNANILSRIGSVTIKGSPLSTASVVDRFAITAQLIAKVSVQGKALPLTAGQNSVPLVMISDTVVLEL